MKKFITVENKEFNIQDDEQQKVMSVFVNAENKLSIVMSDKYGGATMDFNLSDLEEFNLRMQDVTKENREKIAKSNEVNCEQNKNCFDIPMSIQYLYNNREVFYALAVIGSFSWFGSSSLILKLFTKPLSVLELTTLSYSAITMAIILGALKLLFSYLGRKYKLS